MGYRVAWIARAGTSKDELLEVSGRELTGERHDFPDVGNYLVELPEVVERPWVVLLADGSANYSSLNESTAQAISNNSNETIYFWCSDTVMSTELIGYRDGVQQWSIQYGDVDGKRKQPSLQGDVPDVVPRVLKELQAKQAANDGADYLYELTADVGLRLVGLRHDIDLETGEPDPFQVLK